MVDSMRNYRSGITLSLASAGNCTYAMLYRRKIVFLLSDAARARGPIEFRNYLSKIKEDVCRVVRREAYTGKLPNRTGAAPMKNDRSSAANTKTPIKREK